MLKQPSVEAATSGGITRLRTDADYQRQIAQMYREAFREIDTEFNRLGSYIEQQAAKGAPVSPSWLSRQERYLSLQTQITNTLTKWASDIDGLLQAQSWAASRWGTEGLLDQVKSAVGLTGPTGDIGGFGAATWARLETGAMEAAASMLNQNRSPLRALLDNIAPDATVEFRTAFGNGIALGRNPRKIARDFAQRFKGIAQGRAQLIARTEWHRAVRIARSRAFTESKVVRSWIWRCALDRTTCGVCFLMHGTEHPTTETLQGHPGCRCVMIPKTYDWNELGLQGIPNTKPPIEPGASIFRRLPEKEQRRLIGRTRLDMFKSGQMKLKEMTWSKPNATWGPMRVFKTLPPKSFPPPKPGKVDPWFSIDYGSLPRSHDAYERIAATTRTAPVTPNEQANIGQYQGGMYADFNRWARGLPPKSGIVVRATSVVTRYQHALDMITQGLAKASTTHDVLVWRGMRVNNQPIRVGGSFVDRAPISTSTRAGTAEGFTMGTDDEIALLHLLIPKGSKAMAIDEIPGNGGMGEAEILISPNSRVHIIRQIEDRRTTDYTGKTKIIKQYEGVVITP